MKWRRGAGETGLLLGNPIPFRELRNTNQRHEPGRRIANRIDCMF